MFKRIQTILQTECRLKPDQALLVGVSGGPDSLCLIDLLHRSGYPVVVAHLNHGLRLEADEEAQRVKRYAKSSGLPFVLGEEDVRRFADNHSLSLEGAARTVRYRFLFEQAEHFQAQAVAVGHTASDQVETVLMHLLRGAGLSGLKGMTYRAIPSVWSREIPLVRPLLGFWREEIMAYIQERELQPAYDLTNLDTTFFRNRLRHELLPYLEEFNPHVRQSLWRTAQVLAAEEDFIESAVDTAWGELGIQERPGSGADAGRSVAFSRSSLLDQPLAIRRRLLRRAIGRLRPGLRDLDFQSVERGLAVLSAGSQRGQCDLVAALRLRVEGDRVSISGEEPDRPDQDWPQITPGIQRRLDLPGSIPLSDGWVLSADLVEEAAAAHVEARENVDLFQAWVGVESLELPLSVRSRQPGDRFKPLGLDGHSLKLADFMINVKMPQRARDGWPLVLSGDEIVWVPGFRLGHPFRLTPGTPRALHLKMGRWMENRE